MLPHHCTWRCRPQRSSQGHGQGAHGRLRDRLWQTLLTKGSGLGISPFLPVLSRGVEPARANMGAYTCPSPSPPSAWLRCQGPEVGDRDGANTSFNRGWGGRPPEMSSSCLRSRGDSGRGRGCPSPLANTTSSCWSVMGTFRAVPGRPASAQVHHPRPVPKGHGGIAGVPCWDCAQPKPPDNVQGPLHLCRACAKALTPGS